MGFPLEKTSSIQSKLHTFRCLLGIGRSSNVCACAENYCNLKSNIFVLVYSTFHLFMHNFTPPIQHELLRDLCNDPNGKCDRKSGQRANCNRHTIHAIATEQTVAFHHMNFTFLGHGFHLTIQLRLNIRQSTI